MIIKTRFIPGYFSAITLWPFILIRPDIEDYDIVLEHEKVHYREQAWISPVWWIFYLVSKSFRLSAELRAYSVSVRCGAPLGIAAWWLTQYKLDINLEQATALLENEIRKSNNETLI